MAALAAAAGKACRKKSSKARNKIKVEDDLDDVDVV